MHKNPKYNIEDVQNLVENVPTEWQRELTEMNINIMRHQAYGSIE
jgi:hypothetical protein